MKVFDSIDRQPTELIRRVQDQIFLETIAYACERFPYYRKALDSQCLKPESIKSLEDISQLPFTERDDLQRFNQEFLSVPRNETAELVSTTGTTGEPAFIAMTKNDLERLAYNEERSFSCAGTVPGDFFHIAVTCDNLFIAGIAYYSGLLRLGASVVRVGPRNILRHIDLIKDLRPNGIVAVPSFIIRLASLADEIGLNPVELGIKKMVLIGDSIRDSSLNSNTSGKLIEEAFGDICYSTYGLTEGQISFCECREKRGLHSHPELVIAEVVDDEGNSLPDNAEGELVITTLQTEGMPLIRYRTGDITFKISSPCQCSRNSLRIGPILGRKHHKLKFKGVTIYPGTIENAILGIKDIENFQIEAYTGDDGTDHIILRIGSHRKDRDFISSLTDALRSRARVTPAIKIESPESIAGRLHEKGSRKPIIFKDLREKRPQGHEC